MCDNNEFQLHLIEESLYSLYEKVFFVTEANPFQESL